MKSFAWVGFLSSLLLVGASTALAFPAPVQVAPGKISAPLQNGSVIGGQSGVGFSLLGVKTTPSGHGEHIAITYGDRDGKPVRGIPGYFHIQLDHDAKRVVIDLAQVSKTTLEGSAIQRALQSGPLVASSEVTMDPADGSTNITLNLRQPVRLRAGTPSNASDAAQVLLDLEPAR